MAKIKDIPLDLIDEPEHDLRTQASEEGISDLAKSIREIGLIQPITVKKKDGRYEIVAGWRRFAASKLAGLAAVPCRIVDERRDRVEEMRIHENLYREDVTDVDYARYFDYLQREKGLSMDQIAHMVGKSLAFVQQRLELLRGDPQVLAALEGGRISFSVARELISVEDPHMRTRWLRLVIENGATVKTIREWKRHAVVSSPAPEPVSPSPISSPPSEPITTAQGECWICGNMFSEDELHLFRVCERCREAIERGKG